MKQAEYVIVAKELVDKAEAIENAKRPAYCVGDADADVFKSFDLASGLLGITREQVLGVHLIKHFSAIVTALGKPHVPQAEDVEGRCADGINYLKLANAMIKERQAQGELWNQK